tara:strand:+ start:346 stop:540 length:195 start_codon:yes stop_codon:yes gene_type:complete
MRPMRPMPRAWWCVVDVMHVMSARGRVGWDGAFHALHAFFHAIHADATLHAMMMMAAVLATVGE